MSDNTVSADKLYIAITRDDKYVVLLDGKVVGKPFDTAAEAIRAREELAAEGRERRER
jgi:hypothetical protein